MKYKKRSTLLGDMSGLLASILVFVFPFLFMLLNSLKERREANLLNLSIPRVFHWENYVEVFQTNDYVLLKAFKNSMLLTFFSVIGLVVVSSMAGYIIRRRNDRMTRIVNILLMLGLMIPPAVIPTIWVMQCLHVYRTMFGMILIEIALQIPFDIMLYQGFVGTIPVELEEAARIDGCKNGRLFFQIVFPLLKPVTSTIVILNAVTIFNDFTNPLYFLPGTENATVQQTLYNFTGQFSSSYNLLFADVILITLPMFILFIIFNKKIVNGMVAGSIKG
ncbi:carbohydrate ABC transporter permease [Schaedlerella arabinosiphila]|jgi:raffinose/stachyose/melibiose transport system permease protein|uniref:Carbohydrate ABC transporter permease n=1 Tax=Schaedlerella arabinosiphila TaxID=2044587 RepID=A0A3R8KT08_9FIRM|nr:carbohydrate ABC transporter permease [Schaedlerella arabinosiphila]MCI9632706.1 carbohydrate ABC transporter permease [Ruminococcus sp.]RRK31239.1 carbohydrate ABC transporter permease [Schaedlerella arabinosiphila]